jgi:hypothetical protein
MPLVFLDDGVNPDAALIAARLGGRRITLIDLIGERGERPTRYRVRRRAAVQGLATLCAEGRAIYFATGPYRGRYFIARAGEDRVTLWRRVARTLWDRSLRSMIRDLVVDTWSGPQDGSGEHYLRHLAMGTAMGDPDLRARYPGVLRNDRYAPYGDAGLPGPGMVLADYLEYCEALPPVAGRYLAWGRGDPSGLSREITRRWGSASCSFTGREVVRNHHRWWLEDGVAEVTITDVQGPRLAQSLRFRAMEWRPSRWTDAVLWRPLGDPSDDTCYVVLRDVDNLTGAARDLRARLRMPIDHLEDLLLVDVWGERGQPCCPDLGGWLGLSGRRLTLLHDMEGAMKMPPVFTTLVAKPCDDGSTGVPLFPRGLLRTHADLREGSWFILWATESGKAVCWQRVLPLPAPPGDPLRSAPLLPTFLSGHPHLNRNGRLLLGFRRPVVNLRGTSIGRSDLEVALKLLAPLAVSAQLASL